MIQQAIQDANELQQRVDMNNARLARCIFERSGLEIREVWTEGNAFEQCTQRLQALSQQREDIDRAKKAILRRKNLTQKIKEEDGHTSDSGDYEVQEHMDVALEEDLLKLRTAAIKKEELETQLMMEKLRKERDVHVREVRRLKDENMSVWNNHKIFKDRYLLYSMIGKGGFSEVYKV